MRSLLLVHSRAIEAERKKSSATRTISAEYVLRSNGYAVSRADSEELAAEAVAGADAAVLHVPLSEVKQWSGLLLRRKVVPVVWWCSALSASLSREQCEDDVAIDGVLTPSMSAQEMNWTLQFSAKQCYERQQWLNERQQLLSRIEERKWIDMAKGILSEIKHISESEAYDVLRKQAMNERKRMVDVAMSIVKVYQLLQEQKQGRAKR